MTHIHHKGTGIISFTIMALSIMALSIMTIDTMVFKIMTCSIVDLNATLGMSDSKQNHTHTHTHPHTDHNDNLHNRTRILTHGTMLLSITTRTQRHRA